MAPDDQRAFSFLRMNHRPGSPGAPGSPRFAGRIIRRWGSDISKTSSKRWERMSTR
jgi:hypothetical protein